MWSSEKKISRNAIQFDEINIMKDAAEINLGKFSQIPEF
jgi:hypothetical protein